MCAARSHQRIDAGKAISSSHRHIMASERRRGGVGGLGGAENMRMPDAGLIAPSEAYSNCLGSQAALWRLGKTVGIGGRDRRRDRS